MGLRSRRSSSATIQTSRTPSGARSPSIHEEELEFALGTEPGPSTISTSPIAVETPEINRQSSVRLNPKASTSWMRWNAPPPAFPRSKSADKGKGKQRVVDAEMAPSSSPLPRKDQGEACVDAERVGEPEQASSKTSAPVLLQPPEPPPIDEIQPTGQIPPPAGPSRGRGWWPRRTSNASETSSAIKQLAIQTSSSLRTEAEDRTAPLEPVTVDPTKPSEQESKPAVEEPEASVLRPSDTFTGKVKAETSDALKPNTIETASKGWMGYFGWSANTDDSVSQPPPADQAELADPKLVAVQLVPEAPVEEVIASPPTSLGDPAAAEAVDTPAAATALPSRQGWGSYLYSYVPISTPPPKPEDTHLPPSVPIPSPSSESPAANPDHPPQVSIDPATPSQLQPTTSTKNTPPSQPSSRLASPTRKLAKPNTSWLDYLAFRANQKKIADRSAPETGEDVMDFSEDPEFPPTSMAIEASKSVDQDKDKDEKIQNQNLAVRGKRLSTSSTRSASSLAQLASSPAQPSLLESSKGKTPSAPSSTKLPSSSSLPPPPTIPSVQPNLLIPTFATTFDRPPRSLPPLLPTPANIQPPATGTVPAPRPGLAWRALSAARSYVYNPTHPTIPTDVEKSAKGEDEETRGKKEGRGVGGELPRRLAGDQGWIGVRRVVVVGVHGWFPAKMLNS